MPTAYVYHATNPFTDKKSFPEDYKRVARVALKKDSEAILLLEEAFQLTNSINKPWWKVNPQCKKMVSGAVRSTSVGDIITIEMRPFEEKTYRCLRSGWEPITN